VIGTPVGTSTPPRHPADGAIFTPNVRAMTAGDGMCGG
jgi:hypothetical protein